MPVLRNIHERRRSRRLSQLPPRDPEFEDWDNLELMYPEDTREIASATDATNCATPVTAASPADISPPISPSSDEDDDASFVPRSSHSRKRKEGHIPRPPNAFMLFRSELWGKEKVKPTVERDHRQISRIAGHLWNMLSPEQREPYRHLAEQAKRQHARLHPGYKYAPVYRTKGGKRKTKRDPDSDERRCKRLAGLLFEGVEGEELEEVASRMDEAGNSIQAQPPSSRRRTASTSSRAPYASTSRRVAVSTASRAVSTRNSNNSRATVRSPAPAPMSPMIKTEVVSTPELASASASHEHISFVPTSEIPPLSLSNTEDEKEIKREPLQPSFIPPELDPTLVDPIFGGMEPAVVVFDDDYWASLVHSDTASLHLSLSSPPSSPPITSLSRYPILHPAASDTYLSTENNLIALGGSSTCDAQITTNASSSDSFAELDYGYWIVDNDDTAA